MFHPIRRSDKRLEFGGLNRRISLGYEHRYPNPKSAISKRRPLTQSKPAPPAMLVVGGEDDALR